MIAADLYPEIFRRKSIRRYQPDPLPAETLQRVTAWLGGVSPLFPGIGTELSVVPAGDLKGLIQAEAPHCVVAFSEVREGHLANVGFLLEQVALFLSASGLGCCWQGWPKPTKELRRNRELQFVIALAFGAPAEPLHRASVAEFKRKPLEDIRVGPGFDELIEAARLAPYGTSESWFFVADAPHLHVHCGRQRFLRLAEVERIYQINAGIALSHVWIAAASRGRSIQLAEPAAVAPPPLRGYDRVASLRIT